MSEAVASRDALAGAAVVVEADGLVKSYRRGPEVVHALTDVTFTLRRGEFVVLVGPSGSGKTTLLNLLAGWELADGGDVRWDGDADVALADLPWDELAIVPQRLGLVEELSVRENVELPLRLASSANGDGDAQRVEDLLRAFALDDLAERLPAEVSLGQQQRAALARALVRRPRLLLADEPTGHQDEESAVTVMRALRDACEAGSTCLVATHNAEYLPFVDRVLRITDGTVTSDRR